MHDLAEIAPAWSIAHHDDPVPTRQNVLRDGKLWSSAVQLPAPVEQLTNHAVPVDKDPFARAEL